NHHPFFVDNQSQKPNYCHPNWDFPCQLKWQLAIERVISCWLQVQHADLVVAQSKSVSHAAGDYNQRRQDRSNRRFLAAVKTLATVRRLALPIRFDVNVAALVHANHR
ncbi:MAG TPA: hypothetical protein VM260_23405, partial [Pirellula sp.]|nr:hypothetical protein [Pirellula sp.]